VAKGADKVMAKFRINRFWSVLIILVVVYAIVKWLIPAVSRWMTDLPFPLTVPGELIKIYMILAVVAMILLVTFSQKHLDEFLRPVLKFLRAEYGQIPRAMVLLLISLVIGYIAYGVALPTSETPISLRIQHPSSNFPKKFEDLKNPAADPPEAEITAFIEQAKENDVVLIAQVATDVERWLEENPDGHMLSFLPTAPVKKFLAELESGEVSMATAKAALIEKNLFEGRALYAMNCRACHGDSVSGDGPMADGFKLRPINFTDNGTIETIVEGYTFWRVMNGGPGLPVEATPWDSAMPEWKLSLTEEERWKIIMAEYDLAEKTPRIPEGH